MKSVTTIFIFFLLFNFFVTEVLACECVELKLEKRFRKAKVVFIGRVADDSEIPDNNNLVQGDGVQTLKIIESWKGVNKKFIDINFDLESAKNSGMCPTLFLLEEDKEYLIFAYGEEYRIQPVCSDTRVLDKISPYYEHQEKQMKKLRSFWFRFRSELNFF